jgi:hypothetical protein
MKIHIKMLKIQNTKNQLRGATSKSALTIVVISWSEFISLSFELRKTLPLNAIYSLYLI